jgi:hypothetical protein
VLISIKHSNSLSSNIRLSIDSIDKLTSILEISFFIFFIIVLDVIFGIDSITYNEFNLFNDEYFYKKIRRYFVADLETLLKYISK